MTQEIERGEIEINIHHWAIGDVARTRKPNLVAWGRESPRVRQLWSSSIIEESCLTYVSILIYN